MIHMTNISKRDCEITADIIHSTAHTYTTLVRVFDKVTKYPVTNGTVSITSKKGEKGVGQLSDDGTTTIKSDITRKDYKLTVQFHETDEYNASSTKINFKKQYMFFKSMAYIWLSIIGVLLVIMYLIGLNSLLTGYYPHAEITSMIHSVLPYFSIENSQIVFNSTIVFYYLTRVITWILIITFVMAGVYASTHNTNYQNIINKTVKNHFVIYHYLKLLVLALVVLTAVLLIIGFLI